MTGYLLDTNVVSEVLKRSPDATVLAWTAAHRNARQFVSVLTVGALRRGIAKVHPRAPERASALAEKVDAIEEHYADARLDVDHRVMRAWAGLPPPRTLPVIDSLLAATAIAHDLTLVTRNVRDVADLGVPTVNPWDAATR